MKALTTVMSLLTASICLANGAMEGTEQNQQRVASRPGRDLSGADFQTVWMAYCEGETIYAVGTLSVIVATNVPAAIDDEICRSFAATQTADYALFLGLCGSPASRGLLEGATTNENVAIAEAAQMALARRGNVGYEKMFIDRYLANPISAKLEYAVHNRKSIAFVHPLLYIGSVSCIAVLFDIALPSGEYRHGSLTLYFLGAADIRDYLVKAGVEIPKEVISGDDVCAWWKKNRADILKELHDKDPRTLPRLRVMGVSMTLG